MRYCRWLLGAFVLTALLSVPARAQQTFEFIPEVDGYYTLDPKVRLSFQAKQTWQDGELTQGQFGPNIQFFMKPLLSLKRIRLYDLDAEKRRALVWTLGYRYVRNPGKASVNRTILAVSSNLPFKGGLVITDRNRGELNVQAGVLTWRYRNRLSFERGFSLYHFHSVPYGSAEVFYDSRYGKWSSTDLYAGSKFPVHEHVQFDTYYEHQNNTGKHPNRQINAFGLILNLYF